MVVVFRMPPKPLKPCRRPGCSGLTRQQYCDEHLEYGENRMNEARKQKKTDHFYSSGRWQRKRQWIWKRDKGLCQECKRNGHIKVADMVDHITEIKDGGALLDDDNLECKCWSCHAVKTSKARRERNG